MKTQIKAFAILAIIIVVSCKVEQDSFIPVTSDDSVFYATIESPGDPESRVFVDNQIRVRWDAGDHVSIFNRNTFNREYAFNGQTGDNSGTFAGVSGDEFITGDDLDYIYAVYPYQESTLITDDGEISLSLSSEQAYRADSFGNGVNTMISVTDDNELHFKNLCGYFVIKLYGDDVTVTSISLKGNNDEILAGQATVSVSLEGAPSLVFASTAEGKELKMTFQTPVTLGTTAENASEFWFVIPPTTFHNGITLTVMDNKNGIFEKKTTGELTINRNTRKQSVALKITPVPPPSIGDTVCSQTGIVVWISDDYEEYLLMSVTEVHNLNHTDSNIWCESYGTGWRMPTIDELTLIHSSFALLNEKLEASGFQQLATSNQCYWSNTVNPNNSNYYYRERLYDGLILRNTGSDERISSTSNYTRAVKSITRSEIIHYLPTDPTEPPIPPQEVNLSELGTSNCYVVSQPGVYRFNASVKGNSNRPVGAGFASVLWESFGTDTAPQVGDIIKNVSYSDGFIRFETPETLVNGNAVIAIRTNAHILWSWHIWVCNGFDPISTQQVYANNAGILMDRNLGATSAVPGQVQTLGLLYQWGRKDPFLGSSSCSVNIEALASTGGKTVAQAYDCLKVDNVVVNTDNLGYSIEHPTTLIVGGYNGDWYCTSPDYVDGGLWGNGGGKSWYDPCPVGWKVPDGNFFIKAGFSSASTFDVLHRGWTLEVDNSSSAWHPAAGAMDSNGTLRWVSQTCFYWLATSPGKTGATCLDIHYLNGSNNTSSYRSMAGSVRCCKE